MAYYVDVARLRQLVDQGHSQRAIARELGISRTAYQRLVKALTSAAPPPPSTPVLQQILRRLQQLETALRQEQAASREPSPGPPDQPGASASPQATSDLSVRWSVRVPRSVVQHVRTLATVRKQPPSRLVQEALRQWLAGQ